MQLIAVICSLSLCRVRRYSMHIIALGNSFGEEEWESWVINVLVCIQRKSGLDERHVIGRTTRAVGGFSTFLFLWELLPETWTNVLKGIFSSAQTSVTLWVESLGRGFCTPGSHSGSREILWKPVHAASCRQIRSSCVNPRTRRVVLDKLPNLAWKENSHVHTQRAGYIILGMVPRAWSYTASRCKLVSPQRPILHLHGLTNFELWAVVYFALSYPKPGPSIILQERGKTFNSLFPS